MAPDPLIRHHVQTLGSTGPALVFAHGFGTDQRAWAAVAAAFSATHRVVLFDHAGCGRAHPQAYDAERHATLQGYAGDLLEVLDALNLDDVVLVGHSAGGMIGLQAALKAPQRFARLALVCVSPRFLDDPPDYVGGFSATEIDDLLDLMERDQLAWSRTFAPLAMGAGAPSDVLESFTAGLTRLDPLVSRRFGRLVFGSDLRAGLAHIGLPALLLHCRHDAIVPAEVGHYLHRQLRRSTLVELPGHGHCPHITQPQRTAEALRAYLTGDVA